MKLLELKNEFDMIDIDTLTVTITVEKIDMKNEAINEGHLKLMKNLISKEYLKKDYFINFDHKIIEIEDENSPKISAYVVESIARVYKLIDI
ncbi:hypothetical protein [Clostridium cellulovorans]|uniref:Uncharacterized protein n=1 Tax=Clostridium cellulovorans (strain ATCC 35296 / DSM 3052 / OCM 3 / 743B) TaxID=573061 RepID=D9SN21_CLOC7|nr:hypothetical protein [Clostridium cellulovorans]ADL51887.1 hypothetical protein Clocel_2144 [Clostridium cellulovorans 743B]